MDLLAGHTVPVHDSDDEQAEYSCAADAVVARLSRQQPQAMNSEVQLSFCLAM